MSKNQTKSGETYREDDFNIDKAEFENIIGNLEDADDDNNTKGMK